MGKLVLYLVDGTTLDIPLDRERVSIGRRAGNDVCLPYPAVSGKHAVVVTMTTGSVLEDLGSTNGAFVNRKRIARHFLHDGDKIDIGRQKLIYFADVNAVAPALLRRSRGGSGTDDGHGTPAHATGATTTLLPAMIEGSSPSPGETPVQMNSTVRLSVDMFSDSAMSEIADFDASGAKRVADASVGADDLVGERELANVTQRSPSATTIKVLTGPNAGRMLSLDKNESLIGRVGLQVAAVCKEAAGFRLIAVEGADAPKVNGSPVSAEGLLLQTGDVIEMAGARLEFACPQSPSTE